MKYLQTILALTLVALMASCSKGKLEEKGFRVSSSSNGSNKEGTSGLNKDSLKFETQPSTVLMTGIANVRLTTIYKVNKKDESTFIGSNNFLFKGQNEDEDELENKSGNNWNDHLMPGLTGVYGYNLVNVSHYNITENKQKLLFDKPVLIKTVYFPSFLKDTLNFKPVLRNYMIVSVYNDDTNKDGFINFKDLRRIYLFNINGEKQKALIPENYSVFKSEYDSENDLMLVFAQLDANNNGSRDESEPIHIFWIDLKDPNRTGRMY